MIYHQYKLQGINDLLLLMSDYQIDLEIENLRNKMRATTNFMMKQKFLGEIQQLLNRKKFKKGI